MFYANIFPWHFPVTEIAWSWLKRAVSITADTTLHIDNIHKSCITTLSCKTILIEKDRRHFLNLLPLTHFFLGDHIDEMAIYTMAYPCPMLTVPLPPTTQPPSLGTHVHFFLQLLHFSQKIYKPSPVSTSTFTKLWKTKPENQHNSSCPYSIHTACIASFPPHTYF